MGTTNTARTKNQLNTVDEMSTKSLQRLIKNVKSLREAKGMSQAALALKMGVSVSYISKLEQGGVSFSDKSLDALAKALGVDVVHLFIK